MGLKFSSLVGVYDFLYEPAGEFHTQLRKEFVRAAEVPLHRVLRRLQDSTPLRRRSADGRCT